MLKIKKSLKIIACKVNRSINDFEVISGVVLTFLGLLIVGSCECLGYVVLHSELLSGETLALESGKGDEALISKVATTQISQL